eukprot:scaffold8315_cov50-Attheya_sp.AAC.4
MMTLFVARDRRDGESVEFPRFYGAHVPGLHSVHFWSSVHFLASVGSKAGAILKKKKKDRERLDVKIKRTPPPASASAAN